MNIYFYNTKIFITNIVYDTNEIQNTTNTTRFHQLNNINLMFLPIYLEQQQKKKFMQRDDHQKIRNVFEYRIDAKRTLREIKFFSHI